MQTQDLITTDDLKQINDILSVLIEISKEDRAVILSNANAFRVRRDLEKAMSSKDGR